MSDRPILFSGPMVRALLAGTKTQTRRILNPQPTINSAGLLNWSAHGVSIQGPPEHIALFGLRISKGDRLYVRESWNWTHVKDLAPGETLGRTVDECCEANGGFACPCGDGIVYAATNAHHHPEHGKALWKPSIHMPRWASRITLHVTDVRVERLQDISHEDAIAEGCKVVRDACYVFDGTDYDRAGLCHSSPVTAYGILWDKINGDGSWDANPWIAAYTFEVERANIAQARAA